jgi:rare lipoprotein A
VKFDEPLPLLIRLEALLNTLLTKKDFMFKKTLSLFAIATSAYLPFVPAAAQAETATYYSDAYQGSPTASGTPYDVSGYTAAHPSYRLGTVVRVTNRNNGRSVVVTVNDRCNCGIDLSRAAARDIGLLNSGVAPVSVAPLR